jgi:saccharopine dehydrogenase-like NADP-dependent oxidoreductase
MKKVIVLGGGLVGGVIARDLADDPTLQVTVVDRDEGVLARLKQRANVATQRADLADPAAVTALAAAHDFVLGCAPGFLGLAVLRAVIEAGRDCVDISFMPEDARELDDLARQRGVTVVVDCGVAPGMSNLLLGHVEAELGALTRGLILVGGLPVQRRWPWEYGAVFSPIDVIEEYTRVARFVEHGVVVEREALSDPELHYFPGLGTLESFNTDGLRSLMDTIKAPDLKEKTMRWPGHIEKIRVLRETGFFRQDPIDVGGVKVRPLDLTAKLLFPMWQLRAGEEELTVMRVEAEGLRAGKKVRYTYDLLDRTDPARGEMSMARTTGFPATAMARLVLGGTVTRPGVHPPEVLGREPPIYDAIMAALRVRRVVFTETIEELR